MRSVYPVEVYKGRLPVWTDRFSLGPPEDAHRKHLGVDIMLHRLSADPIFVPGEAHQRGSTNFYSPHDLTAVAAEDGQVINVDTGSRGYVVQLRLARRPGIYLNYIHLEKVLVDEGDVLHLGQEIGIIGDDPSNPRDPAHLHFEVRLGNPGKSTARDPAPFLRNAGQRVVVGGVELLLVDGLDAL